MQHAVVHLDLRPAARHRLPKLLQRRGALSIPLQGGAEGGEGGGDVVVGARRGAELGGERGRGERRQARAAGGRAVGRGLPLRPDAARGEWGLGSGAAVYLYGDSVTAPLMTVGETGSGTAGRRGILSVSLGLGVERRPPQSINHT